MNGEEPAKKRKLNGDGLCTYNLQRVLGLGSFGVVYQAQCIETNEIVAIKAMKLTEKDKEVQVLKELIGHPNIVSLKGAYLSSDNNEPSLNVVMEFVSDTLHRIIKHNNALQQPMDALCSKLYIYQLLRAINFVHVHGFMHCDIKPQNLLVNGKSHTLKLCDFGTARRVVYGDNSLRSYVCSRYYRAPELILGSMSYDYSVDAWSAGCVFGEMLLSQPLFTGADGIDQLTEICKVLGSPSAKELRAMNPHYPDYEMKPVLPKIPWDLMFPRFAKDAIALDLVDKFLRFDPTQRFSPLQGLLHRYFDIPLRSDKTKSFGPPLFNFLEEELFIATDEERQKLMPRQ
jgi:glycogen synthase kinase 3 beta